VTEKVDKNSTAICVLHTVRLNTGKMNSLRNFMNITKPVTRSPASISEAGRECRLLSQRAKCQLNADIYVPYPNQTGSSRPEGLWPKLVQK